MCIKFLRSHKFLPEVFQMKKKKFWTFFYKKGKQQQSTSTNRLFIFVFIEKRNKKETEFC